MSDEKNMIWKNTILKDSATIKEAAENLEFNKMKIILVINRKDELIGTVSDGDIRRALIKGKKINNSILEVVNQNPIVDKGDLDENSIIDLMKSNKIFYLPIIDHSNKLIGLHSFNDMNVVKKHSNIMVIMAGGIGSRLLPHTEDCPKPMLLLGGKPMLERIIERAKLEGFSKFIIAVNYLGHIVEDYFGSGKKHDVEIEYTREDKPLGTAGALSLIENHPKDSFVVTNGDVISDIKYGDLLDFHIKKSSSATMAVRIHEWQHPFGVVNLDGIKVKSFQEKPIIKSYINAGVYVLKPSALKFLDGEHCDMPTLFERLQKNNEKTIAYFTNESWIDVGRPDDLDTANREIRSDID